MEAIWAGSQSSRPFRSRVAVGFRVGPVTHPAAAIHLDHFRAENDAEMDRLMAGCGASPTLEELDLAPTSKDGFLGNIGFRPKMATHLIVLIHHSSCGICDCSLFTISITSR